MTASITPAASVQTDAPADVRLLADACLWILDWRAARLAAEAEAAREQAADSAAKRGQLAASAGEVQS